MLDLFAGTGAVGLEALSRGAAAATLVESDRAACDIVRRNVATVGLSGAEVHRAPAASYLVGRGPDEPYDLVFPDPPYAYRDDHLATLLGVARRAAGSRADAVVVVERSARGSAPRWPTRSHRSHERRYGEGMLWYGRAPMSAQGSHEQPSNASAEPSARGRSTRSPTATSTSSAGPPSSTTSSSSLCSSTSRSRACSPSTSAARC